MAELYQLCCPKCNNQTDLIAYATSSKCVNYVFRLYQQASSFVPKRLLQEPCNPQKENKDSPQRLSLLLNVVMNIQTGAGGRTRTGTVSLPMEFESITSANSITPASVEERSYYTLSEEKNQDLGGGAIRFFLFSRIRPTVRRHFSSWWPVINLPTALMLASDVAQLVLLTSLSGPVSEKAEQQT